MVRVVRSGVARVAPMLIVVELNAIRCVVLGPLVATGIVPMRRRTGIDPEVVRVHLQPPLPRVRRGLRLLYVLCMRRTLGVGPRLRLREDVRRHAVRHAVLLKLPRLPASVTALVVHGDGPIVVMIYVVWVVLVAVEVVPAEPPIILIRYQASGECDGGQRATTLRRLVAKKA